MSNQITSVDAMVMTLRAQVADLLPKACVFRFETTVTEALSNVVIHAKTDAPNDAIDIDLRIEPAQVVVDIYDPVGAPPFDMTQAAQPLSQVDLLAEGGRGLGLIMECTSTVHYGPLNGRNRLSLIFKPAGSS